MQIDFPPSLLQPNPVETAHDRIEAPPEVDDSPSEWRRRLPGFRLRPGRFWRRVLPRPLSDGRRRRGLGTVLRKREQAASQTVTCRPPPAHPRRRTWERSPTSSKQSRAPSAAATAGEPRRGLVLLFGAVALALGITGVLLVILQPTFFGTFCTLCLVSAACSISAAFAATGEVFAAFGYFRRSDPPGVRSGKPGGTGAATEGRSWVSRSAKSIP